MHCHVPQDNSRARTLHLSFARRSHIPYVPWGGTCILILREMDAYATLATLLESLSALETSRRFLPCEIGVSTFCLAHFLLSWPDLCLHLSARGIHSICLKTVSLSHSTPWHYWSIVLSPLLVYPPFSTWDRSRSKCKLSRARLSFKAASLEHVPW